MEGSSPSAAGQTGPGAVQQTNCPMCGAELNDQSGTGICRACNWVRRFPAD